MFSTFKKTIKEGFAQKGEGFAQGLPRVCPGVCPGVCPHALGGWNGTCVPISAGVLRVCPGFVQGLHTPGVDALMLLEVAVAHV